MTFVDVPAAIRAYFKAHGTGIIAVYLFGSRARQTHRGDSDADIAVLLANDPPATFEGLCLDLEGELERHLGIRVDLTILNRAPMDLTHRVLRDGQLLVDSNPSERIRFEVRARNEYFDIQSLLKQYRAKRHPP